MRKQLISRIGAAAALICICGPLSAQMLIPADTAKYQAQISRDDEGFSSCGIRSVAIISLGKTTTMYDFSINVRSSVIGVIKAGKYTISTSDMVTGKGNQKVTLPAPIKFWIAKADSGAALRPKKYISAETAGFILGGTEFIDATKIIYAMALGERVQFAVVYKSEKIDSVIEISAKLEENEMASLNACFSGIIDRIQKSIDEEPKK